jgi:succinate dehydrogenase / fumarate reductase cytochrome b subunit
MASDMATSRPTSPAPARPIAPHLQIWRWTATMAASITHRATGVALYSGTIVLAIWVFAVAQGGATFDTVAGFLASPVGLFVLAGYCWALIFHSLNGLRHLYWDTGRGLDPNTARMTAWATYAASIVLTAIVVAAGLSARGVI